MYSDWLVCAQRIDRSFTLTADATRQMAVQPGIFPSTVHGKGSEQSSRVLARHMPDVGERVTVSAVTAWPGRVDQGRRCELTLPSLQRRAVPPPLHRRTLPVSRPAPMALQQLHHLDRSPSKFHDQLSDVLHGEVFQQSVLNLDRNELVWLVDYLDKVCYPVSLPRSWLDFA